MANSSSWFHIQNLPNELSRHRWEAVTRASQLSVETLHELDPEIIFFPHWSFIIPPEIHENYECVIFHTAPLPYGRGGSPIQNLIARGFTHAPVKALKAVKEIDAGPVYLSEDLSLEGSLSEILDRLEGVVGNLINQIVANRPAPVRQEGEPIVFSRRTPNQSRISETDSLDEIYDKIRMVDFGEYPRGYMDYGPFRLSFSSVSRKHGGLSAEVTLRDRRENAQP